MLVTMHGKGRARPKPRTKTTKTRKRTVKGRNAPAAALADLRYRQRVVKSARAYSRKAKTPEIDDEDA
jgi:hypothetical protein